jgi:hypothetical protein
MNTRERMAAIVVALLIGLALTDNAAAQGLTINDYRRPNSQPELDFNKGYLTGIKDGLIAYNMAQDDKLFCLSGGLPTLSFEQANDLTMSWARKKGPDSGGASVSRALLGALRERYPCRAGAR